MFVSKYTITTTTATTTTTTTSKCFNPVGFGGEERGKGVPSSLDDQMLSWHSKTSYPSASNFVTFCFILLVCFGRISAKWINQVAAAAVFLTRGQKNLEIESLVFRLENKEIDRRHRYLDAPIESAIKLDITLEPINGWSKTIRKLHLLC